jgi:hypothetical protein
MCVRTTKWGVPKATGRLRAGVVWRKAGGSPGACQSGGMDTGDGGWKKKRSGERRALRVNV